MDSEVGSMSDKEVGNASIDHIKDEKHLRGTSRAQVKQDMALKKLNDKFFTDPALVQQEMDRDESDDSDDEDEDDRDALFDDVRELGAIVTLTGPKPNTLDLDEDDNYESDSVGDGVPEPEAEADVFDKDDNAVDKNLHVLLDDAALALTVDFDTGHVEAILQDLLSDDELEVQVELKGEN